MEAIDRVNEVPVYAPEGSVDINNSNELRESLIQELENGCRTLVLDLEMVQYIDSSGLSALVAAVNAFEKQDGSLVLCCVDEAVMKVLEMTRLTDYFALANDRSEAMEKAAELVG